MLPRLVDPFFRAVYGYGGTPLTPAAEGRRYRLMILQRFDAHMIPRLKALHPGLKILMYVDMMSSDRRDPTGVSDVAGYADAALNHPDWFLKDASGHALVFKDYPTSYVMDVGNRAYQDDGAARISAQAKRNGLRRRLSGRCERFAAMGHRRWVDRLRDLSDDGAVAGSGVLVPLERRPATSRKPACSSSPTSAARRSHPASGRNGTGPLDGAMEESFTNGGTGGDSIENGRWAAKLAHALWSEANRKISLDHAVTGTRAGARYALATMLLAARGENLFSASTGYGQEVWWPEYATAESLGRPVGGYRLLRNGVYRREFTNGVVLVNPHERTARRVVLGGTYSGSGLDKVVDVSLKPTSGVVLVRS